MRQAAASWRFPDVKLWVPSDKEYQVLDGMDAEEVKEVLKLTREFCKVRGGASC